MDLNRLRSILIHFPFFSLQRRESVCDGQAETNCNEWQISAGHLTHEVEDFHRRHAFRGIMRNVPPVKHPPSPQPDNSPVCTLLSLSTSPPSKGSVSQHKCVLLHQCVFDISHSSAWSARGGAGILKCVVDVLCCHPKMKIKVQGRQKGCDQTDRYSLLCLLLLLHNKSLSEGWVLLVWSSGLIQKTL